MATQQRKRAVQFEEANEDSDEDQQIVNGLGQVQPQRHDQDGFLQDKLGGDDPYAQPAVAPKPVKVDYSKQIDTTINMQDAGGERTQQQMMTAVAKKFKDQYSMLSKLPISEVNASFTATQVKEMRSAVETMFTFMAQFRGNGKSTDISSVFLSVANFAILLTIGKESKDE